jgi:predicted PurR-regulated permease PerM
MHLVVCPLIVLLFLLQRHMMWERILSLCERQMEKGDEMWELGGVLE